MTTKERIERELEGLSEEHLHELYTLIRDFTHARKQSAKETFMSRLRRVQIDGPEDFAANLDLYVSGEKRDQSDLH